MAGTEINRELPGEKAQRIVEAMRAAVGARGVAGATFDVVAREAGVSRGLLHYYFGTKERLLVEVVRRDCEVRMALIESSISRAQSLDDVIGALVHQLEDLVEHAPDFMAMVFELFTLSRHNAEMGKEFRSVLRQSHDGLATALADCQARGVVHLRDDPHAVAVTLFALGDGLAMRMLADREANWSGSVRAGERSVRALLS